MGTLAKILKKYVKHQHYLRPNHIYGVIVEYYTQELPYENVLIHLPTWERSVGRERGGISLHYAGTQVNKSHTPQASGDKITLSYPTEGSLVYVDG